MVKEDPINLEKINFMWAFYAHDQVTNEILHDPSYVDWDVNYWSNDGNQMTQEKGGVHVCTKEDLSKFY